MCVGKQVVWQSINPLGPLSAGARGSVVSRLSAGVTLSETHGGERVGPGARGSVVSLLLAGATLSGRHRGRVRSGARWGVVPLLFAGVSSLTFGLERRRIRKLVDRLESSLKSLLKRICKTERKRKQMNIRFISVRGCCCCRCCRMMKPNQGCFFG